MRIRKVLIATIIMFGLVSTGAQAGWNPFAEEGTKEAGVKSNDVAEAIAAFKAADPKLQTFFDKARGYAIFPSVAKGGIGIGGAYGKGEVYEQGKMIGRTSVSQATIGFQLGGQVYSEIIFFKDKSTLNDFKQGNFKFGAQASAVAITTGASVDADYSDGVAIFTRAKGGLMYEASVGGQKFSYTAK